jgi:pimeloyl-ACP methyl ester carboxylesterase
MDENKDKTQKSDVAASPAASFEKKRRCCFGLFALIGSEGFVVFLAIALTAAISFLFTIGLQLYSLGWPPKSSYQSSPDQVGLNFETVSIPTSDSEITVVGWFIPSAVPSDSAILALHGYGSNKAEVLPRVGFLAARHNLLIIDLRYFGETSGDNTFLGIKGMVEVGASLAWLESRGMGKIGVYGMSMGGGLALRALGEEPSVRCAVVESPFVDYRLVVKDSYRNLGFLADFMTDSTLSALRFLDVEVPDDLIISKVTGSQKPILAIRPLDDKVVNAEHSEELEQALMGNKQAEFWLLPGKGYGDIAEGYVERLNRFYAGCL